MLRNHKHLKPFIIVTRSLSQPHPTLQILRHTQRPTGTIPCSQPGQSTGGLRRVTQTPSTAVPLVVSYYTEVNSQNLINSPIFKFINFNKNGNNIKI
jgi:hypothetical protein